MVLPILISATLFYLSFPNIFSLEGISVLGWIFAIPIFITFEKKNIRDRIKFGFLFGLLSNLAAVNWMIPYSYLGYILLCFALSSQAVIFAILYPQEKTQNSWNIILVPCAWVVSEILRKSLMMGQSWDLAHSQSFDLYFVQWAKVFGSAGISFILILINYFLYKIFFCEKKLSRKIISAGFLVLVMMVVYGYGFWIVSHEKNNKPTALRICAIQANINYHGELSDTRIEKIIDQYVALTREALQNSKLDLVVWPETAIPTDFFKDEKLKEKVLSLVKDFGIPFVIGAIIEDQEGQHNSAILIDGKGKVQSLYFKRHLIPLTEYIPSTIFWKFLAKIFRVESPQLIPGKRLGMMTINLAKSGNVLHFGVAICSEDNISQLFREYTKQGSDFVLVLLNNGWFSQKAGLVMHAQHSMMRAVENSMPIIRVGNTGLSGLIDPWGRHSPNFLKFLQERKIFYYDITLNSQKSVNHKVADTFCVLCLVFVILMQVYKFIKPKEKR